jgi:cell wall-associated NlpC family hydrolase
MIGNKGILWIMTISGVLGLTACSSLKKGTNERTGSSGRGNVEFLDGLSINGSNYAAKSKSTLKFTASSTLIENAPLWQFKYAQLLDVRVETVLNTNLFAFIEDWWGTPYVYGGKNKNGVDCSGFANNLLVAVFRINSSGSSAQLYAKARKLSKSEMREGDLVFFKTDGKSISHVGVYLNNNKFVHASTSLGVTISDLNETYWARYYAGSGRIE